MFTSVLMNRFFTAGDDVAKMHQNFMSCCGEMMFTRRHIGKDMLTHKFYQEEEQHGLRCYDVPFARQIFNHPLGGTFSVHNDNVALVPLFQRHHLLFETHAIELVLDVPDDAPLPKVNVLRSSGMVQDAWLKKTVSLCFSRKSREWTPHIHMSFLDAPKRTIEVLCKAFYRKHHCDTKILDEFSVKEWQERETRCGRTSEVFQIVGYCEVKLTKAFVDYFVSQIQLDIKHTDILKEVETIESIMTERMLSKHVSLAEFMRLNPSFNIKMKVHKLEVDEESDATQDKMACVLNEFLDHQMRVLKKHTMLTDMEQFFDLITVE